MPKKKSPMNITISRSLILSIMMFATTIADSPILPNADIQQQMLAEEQAFLASMKPGLQHTQMLAVRAAIDGDDTALQQIRASRNAAPTLPQGVQTTYIKGAEDHLSADICLFEPTANTARKRPLLLYLHGGGWCFGSINSCARFCAAVALKADCCVAALNYRLAPAHPFPTALNDCKEAFAYLSQHAAQWGCDSTLIAVGGDSAGGNLALATALSVKGVSKVIPIYPVTKLFSEPTASWQEYAKGYGDDAELLEAFNEAYAGTDTHNPLVSVGLASDEALRALPPMLIISAGHDILFDQTAEFAQRLKHLGCPLQYHVYPTATHLFITVPGQPTAFDQAVTTTASFLNATAQLKQQDHCMNIADKRASPQKSLSK